VGAAARADAKPTAVVSMGDSYISGEAGRWAGNSATGLPVTRYDGTDRGRAVYGTTDTDPNTCHRSDVAEVISARIAVDRAVNLACSGAVTKNLLTTAEGGEGQGGEAPQGDQLKTVAATNRVKAVVVSIGGNDLGFADIVVACFAATPLNPCKPSQQPKLSAGLPVARQRIEGVIDSIRKVMSGAGYPSSSYRLILQGYPSVAPRAAENRYPIDGDPRRVAAGCQFTNVDSDWARDQASAQIGQAVGDAARAKGAEFLDLHDLFQGHEVCAQAAAQATALAKPDAAHSEWGRPVGVTFIGQGSPNGTQESFHPNAFGQQAFGACLRSAYAAKAGRFTCRSAAGRAPANVIFARTSAP
jgi:hypothetical protein